jgi:hypothetical protein
VSADADDEGIDDERTESSFTDEGASGGKSNNNALLSKAISEIDWDAI